MPTVVVLGAGPIGAAVTHQLVREAIASRVILVDRAAAVAQGLALDIRQAAPVHGVTSATEATSDLSAVVGAAAIVVADRHGDGEWRGDEALALLTSVRAMNPRALILCAGATQSDLVEALVRERDFAPRLIAGTAAEAARSAARHLIALEAGAEAGDVSVAMVGRPPLALFPAWDGASIGGSRAADVLPPPVVTRLERQLAAVGPGPLTLATAAARVVRQCVRQTPGWTCLFVVPAERGRASRGVAVPAAIDESGVRPAWPALSPRDRTRLETLAQR